MDSPDLTLPSRAIERSAAPALSPAAPVVTARSGPVLTPPGPPVRPVAPRVLVVDGSPAERWWKRSIFLLLGLLLAAGTWYFLSSFLATGPGRPGIDENAYLVAGKTLAQHGTTGFFPGDDFQFVGAMYLRAENGGYYPKYPFGTSLLYAITFLLGHREWAFAVSPLCIALASLGMFLLARMVVGSFYATLAMIVLVLGPTTLQLSIIPNSHAPALCFVVWGMYCLLGWCRCGRWWLGAAAGLLLGFAVTIRYTEALLLFPFYALAALRTDEYISPNLSMLFKVLGFLPVGPIGIAVLYRLRWRSLGSYLAAAVPILAWGVPVTTLVLYNYFTLGSFTGYDDTNESSGFSVPNFLSKWDFAVYQLYLFGLFFIAPLGVAGLIAMYRGARLPALLLTMWFVPGALLYTAYYWGEEMPSVAFLRFFLTLYPPLIIGAVWLLRSAQPRLGGSIAAPVAAGVIPFIAAAAGLVGSLGELERQHRGTLNLAYSAERVMSHLKHATGGRPMVLADAGMFPQLLQHLQFMADADWYASDIFAARSGGGFGIMGVAQKSDAKGDPNTPVLLQRARIEHIDQVRKGMTDADFIRVQHGLFDKAFAAGRKVFVVLVPTEAAAFTKKYITPGYQMVELERWDEPCTVKFPARGEKQRLVLSVWDDNLIVPWHPISRVMYEIRPASAAPPSTSPTTKPTALPATAQTAGARP